MKYNETQKAEEHVLEHELPCNRLTRKEVRGEEHGRQARFGKLAEQPQCLSVCRDGEPQQAQQPAGTKHGGLQTKWERAVDYSSLIVFLSYISMLLGFPLPLFKAIFQTALPRENKMRGN